MTEIIERIQSNPELYFLVTLEVALVLAFLVFAATLMWKTDKRSKETHRRMRESDEEYQKTMAEFRRNRDRMQSVIDDMVEENGRKENCQEILKH